MSTAVKLHSTPTLFADASTVECQPLSPVYLSLPAPVRLWKAVFDRGLASVLLVLTAPFVLAAAALVRLTTPGPAFYSQVRLGMDGRRFTIWKLRTMYHDCEAVSGIRWCGRGDPRVTRVGAVLRATHVDELPQLWNVLRGEMSLIGPRPERPEIAAELARIIPGYEGRLVARPGLSGLAQVLLPPDSNLESVRRKLRLDLRYIETFGPGLDARITVATVLHLLRVPPGTIARLLGLPRPGVGA